MKLTVKNALAIFTVIVAAVLSIWALLLPPQGKIDQSVLFLTAQFLLFAATLLGVDLMLDKFRNFMK